MLKSLQQKGTTFLSHKISRAVLAYFIHGTQGIDWSLDKTFRRLKVFYCAAFDVIVILDKVSDLQR